MDFHVITPQGSELIMQLVGGQVIIVPAPAEISLQIPQPFSSPNDPNSEKQKSP